MGFLQQEGLKPDSRKDFLPRNSSTDALTLSPGIPEDYKEQGSWRTPPPPPEVGVGGKAEAASVKAEEAGRRIWQFCPPSPSSTSSSTFKNGFLI